ncbi:MAG: hypothetical protein ACK40O_01720 [Allosphingosinicella sp.]
MKALYAAGAAVIAAAAFAPLALPAQEIALPAPAGADERIVRVVVYGNDPCPTAGAAEEIVVCARRPDSERYRVPEPLRDEATDDPENVSWAARAESLEYVGRTGIQSCSTVGPGGFTGCWAEIMRAARDERRAAPGNEPGR